MKRDVHNPQSHSTKEGVEGDLTTVELLWLAKRIENRIRFGRSVSEKLVDRCFRLRLTERPRNRLERGSRELILHRKRDQEPGARRRERRGCAFERLGN